MLTQQEVIREMCRISALVYHSMVDYSEPNDGFCDLCPYSGRPGEYQVVEKVSDYIRQAVLEKLKADGHEVAKGFDPKTGKEIIDVHNQNEETETKLVPETQSEVEGL